MRGSTLMSANGRSASNKIATNGAASAVKNEGKC